MRLIVGGRENLPTGHQELPGGGRREQLAGPLGTRSRFSSLFTMPAVLDYELAGERDGAWAACVISGTWA